MITNQPNAPTRSGSWTNLNQYLAKAKGGGQTLEKAKSDVADLSNKYQGIKTGLEKTAKDFSENIDFAKGQQYLKQRVLDTPAILDNPYLSPIDLNMIKSPDKSIVSQTGLPDYEKQRQDLLKLNEAKDLYSGIGTETGRRGLVDKLAQGRLTRGGRELDTFLMGRENLAPEMQSLASQAQKIDTTIDPLSKYRSDINTLSSYDNTAFENLVKSKMTMPEDMTSQWEVGKYNALARLIGAPSISVKTPTPVVSEPEPIEPEPIGTKFITGRGKYDVTDPTKRYIPNVYYQSTPFADPKVGL